MTKPLIVVAVVLIVALLAGFIGYYLGAKRAIYRHSRWEISTASSSNAKLDAEYLDRIQRDNDVAIYANYYGIQTLPKWLIPIFTLGEERSSEKRIEIVADGIEESLQRSGIEEPRETIEAVARDWLAFHTVGPTIRFDREAGIEQGGADQPATAPESEPEAGSTSNPDSEGPSQ